MPSSAMRISIGFQGGQVLAPEGGRGGAEDLNKALGTSGWHELASEEGPVRLDLAQVLYVRSESDELRVGFGA